MGSDSGISCMGVLGAEVILAITSAFMALAVISIALKDFYRLRFITLMSNQSTMALVSLALNLLLPLMSYTFSQVKQQGSSNARVQLILIWMVLTEIIRQKMDATSSGKSLATTTSTTKLLATIEQLARIGWVSYLIYSSSPIHKLKVALSIICVSSIAQEVAKYVAFKQAKGSCLIGKNPEIIGSHVKIAMLQDNLHTTPLDHCDYLVLGEDCYQIVVSQYGYQILHEECPEFLTIGRVFQLRSAEQDQAFSSVLPGWRENCISLALAKMLRRRFTNLPMDEAGSSKALDFVLKGLINYESDNGDLPGVPQEDNLSQEAGLTESSPIERLFGILNEELCLVSKFLHSKILIYQFLMWSGFVDLALLAIIESSLVHILYTIFSLRSTFLIGGTKDMYSQCISQLFSASGISVLNGFDLFTTVALSVACVYLQYAKISIVSSTSLFLLKYISIYAANPREWKEPSPSLKHLFKYFENRLKPQEPTGKKNSVLDIKGRIIFCTKVGRWIFKRLPKVIKRKLVNIDSTKITTDVKEAVVRSFRESSGRLTNGESSLRNHGMVEQLSWACHPNGSTTKAILIWHIATTLFNHKNPAPEQGDDPSKQEREVALTLSSYCHYLVASLPELLPDDVKWTEKVYGDLKEAILSIDSSSGNVPPVSGRCDCVLQATSQGMPVLEDGTKLAKQLMEHAEDQERVWKMLADFWAELMLFIAPSENIDGHEENLERVELITQLWALLTHAGILSRPKPSKHHDHDGNVNTMV